MGKPELLAPAGSYDAMVAAVRAGADAVYLGVGAFNARRNAHNFSLESSDDAACSLQDAVSFCHMRGVKVHLTLNTLVRDRELSAAVQIAEQACACGVDALIVQDRGLARCLHAAAPTMPLHASTQLSCHTPEGVRLLRDVGFSRVVLAREMSHEEIAACADLGCELEVFVHGALCMSVSGQCELSAMLGGRSGNRGLCAQPCRLPFAVGHRPKEGESALSLKDQSLYGHIEELKALGVASLKIEGRMKRPEYVAAATAVFRRLLDGEMPDPQLLTDLQAVFSRSGFTDAYFTGKRGADLFGSRRAEDVASPAVLARLSRLYDREVPRVSVTVRLTDAPLTLTATDEDGNTVSVTAPSDTPIRDNPPSVERVTEQLKKAGGTPFTVSVAEALTPSVPLSTINTLRHRALDDLCIVRGMAQPILFDKQALPAETTFPRNVLSGLVARAERAEQVVSGADHWIVPLGCVPKVPQWGVEIPRGMFGTEESVRQALKRAAEAGASFALCNNVGAVPLAREAGLAPIAGSFWNITNPASLSAAAEDGAVAAILSFELTFPQMRFAEQRDGVGFFAYGRQPLMLLRACPVSADKGCTSCGGNSELIDRTGARFPVRCSGGCSELLNAVPLYLADRLHELPKLAFQYLHFTDETPERVAEVLCEYRQGGTPPERFTRGLYKRGVE